MLLLLTSILFIVFLLPWALFSFLLIVFLIRYYPLSPLAWFVVAIYLLITSQILFYSLAAVASVDWQGILDQIRLQFQFL